VEVTDLGELEDLPLTIMAMVEVGIVPVGQQQKGQCILWVAYLAKQ